MFKSKLNSLQLFTLLVLVGFASCEKEENILTQEENVIFEVLQLKEGGDDDEDPIVQGVVTDRQENPLEGVLVEIYEQDGIFPVDTEITSEDGLFSFQVPKGKYFLMVTPPNQNPVTSDVFNLVSNMSITVQVR